MPLTTSTNAVVIGKISDILIAISYCAIPCQLIYFSCKIRINYRGIPSYLIPLFLCFIFFCGLTHLFNVVLHHKHMLLIITKVLTALASVLTALVLVRLIPSALTLPVRFYVIQDQLHLKTRNEQILQHQNSNLHKLRSLTQAIHQSPLKFDTISQLATVELTNHFDLVGCYMFTTDANNPVKRADCIAQYSKLDSLNAVFNVHPCSLLSRNLSSHAIDISVLANHTFSEFEAILATQFPDLSVWLAGGTESVSSAPPSVTQCPDFVTHRSLFSNLCPAFIASTFRYFARFEPYATVPLDDYSPSSTHSHDLESGYPATTHLFQPCTLPLLSQILKATEMTAASKNHSHWVHISANVIQNAFKISCDSNIVGTLVQVYDGSNNSYSPTNNTGSSFCTPESTPLNTPEGVDGKHVFALMLHAPDSMHKNGHILADAIAQIEIALDQAVQIELEASRQARTAALEGEKNEAEALNGMKTVFLATISHELRTPMNAIIGFVDLLLSQYELPVDMREILDIVSVSSNTLLNLVNGILDLSKLEFQGKQFSLEQVPVSLTNVVEQSIEVVYPTADKRRIQLVAILNHDLDWVVGDQDRIRQILVNFLSNAIKFTSEQGSVSLTVTSAEPPIYLTSPDKLRQQRVLNFHGNNAHPTVGPQSLVARKPIGTITPRICHSPTLNVSQQESSLTKSTAVLSPSSSPVPEMTHVFFQVKDTGIGIEQDKIHLLFEKFQQLDSTIARQFQGTGLGLAIASRLVELHRGQIVVDSVPGVGSLFTVMLCFPRLQEQPQDQVPVSTNVPASNVVLDGLRVGLVVLNDLDRQAIQALLKRLGCTTICMEVIPECHHPSSSTDFDNISGYPYFSVLLVDQSASDQDQARLCQWSLQMPIISIIPIKKSHIANCASGSELSMFDGGVLSKPLRLRTLKHKLCTVMSEFQSKNTQDFQNAHRTACNSTTTITTTTVKAPNPKETAFVTSVNTELHPPLSVSTATRTELVPTATKPPPLKEPRAVRAEYQQFMPLHVLVVDDNCINQMVAVRILKSLGITNVATAGNGSEAVIHVINHEDLDVVFMDVFMPVMDGLEATKIIVKNLHPNIAAKQHAPTPPTTPEEGSNPPFLGGSNQIPFICAMTASAFPEERTTCLNSGMHDFVSKPLRQADLASVLMRYIQWRDQQLI